MELKDGELKHREEKIKREIELFYNPIMMSKDMDKFKEQEMKKKRLIKKIGMAG